MIFFCPVCCHLSNNNDPTHPCTIYGELKCNDCKNTFYKLKKIRCGCCLCDSCITRATPEVIIIDSSDDKQSLDT